MNKLSNLELKAKLQENELERFRRQAITVPAADIVVLGAVIILTTIVAALVLLV